MINIAVNGARGRMGKTVISLIEEEKEKFRLVGAIEHSSHGELGKRISEVFPEVILSSDYKEGLKDADIVIDFSTPEALSSLLDYLLENPKRLVSGTTGLNQEIIDKIKRLGEKRAVLYSPNMSIGVNILFWLVKKLSPIVKDKFDIGISEIHHRFKRDAPSGTALKLAEILSKETGEEIVPNRWGIQSKEKKKGIDLNFIRGGDIVGEHSIYFLGIGESLILTHRANSRKVFAKGALLAVEFINRKERGVYSIEDILELR